jgi:hypothetical protein
MPKNETLWDHEPLWGKALVYMERALSVERDEALFPFWASLALEFVARSTLAYIHPALLAADSERDGSLLYAFGYVPKTGRNKPFVPKSIDISEVLSRCEQVVPDFTQELGFACAGMVRLRNEELHSGGLPFEGFRNDLWLPGFYRSCEVLLKFQKKTLKDLFGAEEAKAAETVLKSIADEAAKAVKGLIHAHAEVWKAKTPEEKTKLVARAKKLAVPENGHVVDCPACKSKCLLNGEEIRQQQPELEGDSIVLRQIMLPTSLVCSACGLVISGHAALHASDLGKQFTSTSYYDPLEFYGGIPIPEEEYDNE